MRLCNNRHLFMFKRQWGGTLWGFCPFFLSCVKPYPLSAQVKVSQQTKLCTLGECSRKHQAQVKCVLPAAITAEPCSNSRTNFISLSIPGQRTGLGGFLPIPTAAVAALTCMDWQWLSTAHPVITDHTYRTIKRLGDDRNLSGGTFGCFMALGWSCGVATC